MTSIPNKEKIDDEVAYIEEMARRAEAEEHMVREDAITVDNNSEYTYRVEAASSDVGWAYSSRFDEANALQLHTPIIFDDGQKFWMWSRDESCYIQIDKTKLLNILLSASKDTNIFKAQERAEIVRVLESTGRNRWEQTNPVPVEWIQFIDCVYDIKTDEIHEATPEYFYINPIPHKLGKDASTPVIDRLINEWVSEDDKTKLYEILAYAFLNDYPIHRIFTFFGSGRNGKGQFMNLLNRLVGGYNICSTSLEKLSDSRFESTRLRGKKLAFISETNTAVLQKTDQLKALSGGDVIGGEYKGGAFFEFTNTAKLVIATNSLPSTSDMTRGFFARWIIIDFPNEFDGGKPVIDEISESEYENLCRKCVSVLQDLLERGKFTNEGSVSDRGQKYTDTSDPMSMFVRDVCIESWDAREPIFNFVSEYQKWCNSKHFRSGKEGEIRKQVSDRFETVKRDPWEIDGEEKHWHTILGIQIRDSKYSTENALNDKRHEKHEKHHTYTSSLYKRVSENAMHLVLSGAEVKISSLKAAIYKVGYVRSIEVFNSSHVLMEMDKGLGITTDDIESALVEHQVELNIAQVDGGWSKA